MQVILHEGEAQGQYYLSWGNKSSHVNLTQGQQLFYYAIFVFLQSADKLNIDQHCVLFHLQK